MRFNDLPYVLVIGIAFAIAAYASWIPDPEAETDLDRRIAAARELQRPYLGTPIPEAMWYHPEVRTETP